MNNVKWNRIGAGLVSVLRRRHPAPARIGGVEYAVAPDIRRLVFICGLHRSGTTLLERHLVRRFECAYLRASVPESEGQHMQRIYPSAEVQGGPGRFAFAKDGDPDIEELGGADRVRSLILSNWSSFIVGRDGVLVEKSPPNLIRIDWLRKVFSGARFVIVVRDPRAVSAATQKWSRSTLPELMMHWNVAYSRAMASFHENDCLVVRYEDLCEDLDRELESIGIFASLVPSSAIASAEERFVRLENSNSVYFEKHSCPTYGEGVWSHFGYAP